MPVLTFDYRSGWLQSATVLVIASLFALSSGWFASENNSRIDIFGKTLSVEASAMLLWGIAAFFALGIPVGLKMLLLSMAKPRQVVLTATDITAPKAPIYKTTTTIALRDITRLRVSTVHRTTVFEIKAGKQKLGINKTWIQPASQFDVLRDTVEKRAAAAAIRG
ncbi:hypothetical protein [Yoonia sp. R2-816]|uniref:hypothetical protein n=1 Tax=Yoonia sp. R2-816 TaxID=3342638 RepID=UPI00372C7A54